jgi:lysophospholipase L1-like esterase
VLRSAPGRRALTYGPRVLRRPTSPRTRLALVAVALVLAVAGTLAAGFSRAEAHDSVLAVYGDSYSAGGRQGGKGDDGWPAIVADHLDADLRLHAAGGAGYVNGSKADDETFLDQVLGAPEPDADVVVVFGSRNDRMFSAGDVKSQAVQVFDAIRRQSPGAELVVVGPAWDDDSTPAEMFRIRDSVAAAAAAAGALFVDPLTQEWLYDHPQLIGLDGVHPNNLGHAYLATRIGPYVREALRGEPAA